MTDNELKGMAVFILIGIGVALLCSLGVIGLGAFIAIYILGG